MSIEVGDVVVATRDGGHDSLGRPHQRPRKGKTYRITCIYRMKYGLGCTLEGMNPEPYLGYFLHVNGGGKRAGWYFKKMEPADEEFTSMLRKLKEKERGILEHQS